VAYQKQLPVTSVRGLPPFRPLVLPVSDALGVPAHETNPAEQSDAFKELVNKLAWALGSTYRVQYGHVRTNCRKVAIEMAKIVVSDHGYPAHIQKD